MKIEDCKIGGRVQDNLALPWLNQGTGTIVDFCKNVHEQDIIKVEWDSPRFENISLLAPENVDQI